MRTGGYIIAWWTDDDYKDVVEAAKIRSSNARKRGAKLLRGITEEECFPRDIDGCLGEKMFNRGMEWSEEWTPYVHGTADSNGWEIKSSAKWSNLLVPNNIMVYQHRPVCRVQLIMRDKLAIIGGWCFIRDAEELSYKPMSTRRDMTAPDGVLIKPTALLSIVSLKHVHGEEVHRRHWLDL